MDRVRKRRTTRHSAARQRIAPSGCRTWTNAYARPSKCPGKGLNVLTNCRYGWMLSNRHDIYIGRSLVAYGEFAELEIELLCQILRPGQTVIDVGANIGTHTLAFARMVGPQGVVYAFEPQRIIFQMLCANLALNSVANVRAFQAPLGSRSGSASVPVPDYDRPNNFGGLSLNNSTSGEIVRLLTLDELHLKSCHLIKIDVEGMESEVLKGATQTVRRFRPVLYVESDRAEKSSVLVEQIQRFGYRLWSHTPALFNPDDFARNRKSLFPQIVSANILCLPKKMETYVKGLRELTCSGARAGKFRCLAA